MISIITPVHNGAAFIGQTIESVLAQTFQDWELILIDDKSADDSQVIMKSFKDSRIRVLINDENLGAAGSRNRGVNEAKGQYLAYLDADDIWDPEKLSKQYSFMKERDCAFSCTSYEFGDKLGRGTGKIVKAPVCMGYEKALSRTIIFTSTVMIDLEKTGKDLVYMPEIPSEDTASWWKILKGGFMVFGIQESLTVYRRPIKSLSSNKAKAVARIWNLYRNQEKLSFTKSSRELLLWAFRATLRRI